MAKVKVLGLGHPRTGTKYTAECLLSFGLEVGHEILYGDGIVAWQLVHPVGPWPYMPHLSKVHKERPEHEYLIYNLRDPKKSIPSIIFTEHDKDVSNRFIAQSLGIVERANRVERAVLSILRFDYLITQMKPDLVFRVEDEHDKLFEFAKKIHPSAEYAPPTNQRNARSHDGLVTLKEEIASVPSEAKSMFNQFCIRNGYEPFFKTNE